MGSVLKFLLVSCSTGKRSREAALFIAVPQRLKDFVHPLISSRYALFGFSTVFRRPFNDLKESFNFHFLRIRRRGWQPLLPIRFQFFSEEHPHSGGEPTGICRTNCLNGLDAIFVSEKFPDYCRFLTFCIAGLSFFSRM